MILNFLIFQFIVFFLDQNHTNLNDEVGEIPYGQIRGSPDRHSAESGLERLAHDGFRGGGIIPRDPKN